MDLKYLEDDIVKSKYYFYYQNVYNIYIRLFNDRMRLINIYNLSIDEYNKNKSSFSILICINDSLNK